MYKNFIIPTAMIAALALAGCASMPGLTGYGYGYESYNQRPYPNSANVYTQGQAQQIDQVRLGTVIAVQHVQIQTGGSQKMIGEGIGALAGGVLGNQVGGGSGKTLGTVAGALGGAVVGSTVAAHHFAQRGLQITIKLDGQGGDIAVTQQTGPLFAVGQRVEVIGGGWNSPARVEPID